MDHQHPTPAKTGGSAAIRNAEPGLVRQSTQPAPRKTPATDRTGSSDEQGLVEYASWLVLLRKRVA